MGICLSFVFPAMSQESEAEEEVVAGTLIMGENETSIDRMYYFVKAHNDAFPRELAEAFFVIADRYGVRGDIALCQAILETGWFGFGGGTAVTPDQFNYGGLGVTELGQKGNAFESMEEGVTALIQHLYAYATHSKLPDGETLVDRRFNLVNRGCAETWEALSGRWASNPNYGRDILLLFDSMQRFKMPDEYYSEFD